MTVYIEIGLFLAGFTTAWFVDGVVRMRKLSASGDLYIKKFAELCEDENIPLHFLDAINNLFKSAGSSLKALYFFYYYFFTALVSGDGRRIGNIAAEIGNLPQESYFRLAECYFLLFKHLSYNVPVFGFMMRNFILGSKPRSASSLDEARLISAVDLASRSA